MMRRRLAWALAAGCLAIVASGALARGGEGPSIRYVPLDAPEGMSQAVIVEGLALVHTRQLLPLDRQGNVVGGDSADRQIQQVLDNLQAVLADAGSGMDKLVRVHVYALSTQIVDRFREQLRQRLGPAIRPAITSVLTPLPHRKALVAADAVAGTAPGSNSVALRRCAAVAGDPQCADAAVLPRGGVAYLSGQPDEGGLTASAVSRSMSTLMKTLEHLKLSPRHVVQVKVFLRPMTSAEEVRREVQQFFPGQIAPPMVFVEWLASMPVEIELIAQFPLSRSAATAGSRRWARRPGRWSISRRPMSGLPPCSAKSPCCKPTGRSTSRAFMPASLAAANRRPCMSSGNSRRFWRRWAAICGTWSRARTMSAMTTLPAGSIAPGPDTTIPLAPPQPPK